MGGRVHEPGHVEPDHHAQEDAPEHEGPAAPGVKCQADQDVRQEVEAVQDPVHGVGHELGGVASFSIWPAGPPPGAEHPADVAPPEAVLRRVQIAPGRSESWWWARCMATQVMAPPSEASMPKIGAQVLEGLGRLEATVRQQAVVGDADAERRRHPAEREADGQRGPGEGEESAHRGQVESREVDHVGPVESLAVPGHECRTLLEGSRGHQWPGNLQFRLAADREARRHTFATAWGSSGEPGGRPSASGRQAKNGAGLAGADDQPDEPLRPPGRAGGATDEANQETCHAQQETQPAEEQLGHQGEGPEDDLEDGAEEFEG